MFRFDARSVRQMWLVLLWVVRSIFGSMSRMKIAVELAELAVWFVDALEVQLKR